MKYGGKVLWRVCKKRESPLFKTNQCHVGIVSNVQMWRLCKKIQLSQDKSPFYVLNWDKIFWELYFSRLSKLFQRDKRQLKMFLQNHTFLSLRCDLSSHLC